MGAAYRLKPWFLLLRIPAYRGLRLRCPVQGGRCASCGPGFSSPSPGAWLRRHLPLLCRCGQRRKDSVPVRKGHVCPVRADGVKMSAQPALFLYLRRKHTPEVEAVQRAGAVFFQSFTVFSGSITFMPGKAVFRPAGVEPGHKVVAEGLGKNGRGGNGRDQSITVHYGFLIGKRDAELPEVQGG